MNASTLAAATAASHGIGQRRCRRASTRLAPISRLSVTGLGPGAGRGRVGRGCTAWAAAWAAIWADARAETGLVFRGVAPGDTSGMVGADGTSSTVWTI